MSLFNELGLSQAIVNALTDLGYEQPTPIQEKTIPQILSSHDDLKAFAQTGTGKTAAFSLPVLEQVDTNSKNTQCIILNSKYKINPKIFFLISIYVETSKSSLFL